jgi:hypothetical protein
MAGCPKCGQNLAATIHQNAANGLMSTFSRTAGFGPGSPLAQRDKCPNCGVRFFPGILTGMGYLGSSGTQAEFLRFLKSLRVCDDCNMVVEVPPDSEECPLCSAYLGATVACTNCGNAVPIRILVCPKCGHAGRVWKRVIVGTCVALLSGAAFCALLNASRIWSAVASLAFISSLAFSIRALVPVLRSSEREQGKKGPGAQDVNEQSPGTHDINEKGVCTRCGCSLDYIRRHNAQCR